MGRMIHNRLDLLYPKADKKVKEHQTSQKANRLGREMSKDAREC